MNKENLLRSKFIKVDVDESYEMMSWLSRAFNFVWIMLATLLPYKLSNKILVKSKKAKTIKTYSTQYRALEEMYTYNSGLKRGRGTFFDYVWLNQRNPRALRNRLKLFNKILEKDIDARPSGREIHVLSLGSGSARGVIESLAKLRNKNKSIRALLIDRDVNAINYSKELAKQYDVQEYIQHHQVDIEDSFNVIREFNPDIIEMVGILDYFKDKRVIRVLDALNGILSPGTIIITANINSNLEERFISKTVKWKMIYRSPREFYDLLAKTKFAGNINIIYEPLMIHGVAVLIKDHGVF